jgi:hypothetical protein
MSIGQIPGESPQQPPPQYPPQQPPGWGPYGPQPPRKRHRLPKWLLILTGVAAAFTGLVVGLVTGLGSAANHAANPNSDPKPPATAPLSSRPAAAAPAAPAPAAAGATALPVLSVTGYSGREPGWLAFSGDAGYLVGNITWQTWGPDQATGTGTSDIQGCVPNCAQGSETPVTATVTLSVPVAAQYTQVAVTRAGDGASRSGPVSYIQGAQQVSPAMAPATAAPSVPGPGNGGSRSYVTDIANAGIIAPEPWLDQTGQQLCADWNAGQTIAQTDPVLVAGGIQPGHLSMFDSITVEDLCPTTPGGPNA